MHVSKHVEIIDGDPHQQRGDDGPPRQEVPAKPSWLQNGEAGEPRAVVYVDPQALTRDCIGRWLQIDLKFRVLVFPDLDQIEACSAADGKVATVIINTGAERISSEPVARRLSVASDLLPDVPLAVLSWNDDPESIRQAFELGVSGYIPINTASQLTANIVQLLCDGGTFAPASTLLAQGEQRQQPAARTALKGFTERQSQILDCLRRGMANKLIAYELDMCESTVKVHIRNIMKKLKATNRTEVAYLTRDLFEDAR